MAPNSIVVFLCSSLLLLLLPEVTVCRKDPILADREVAGRKVYIVYMGNHRREEPATDSLHLDILNSVVTAESQELMNPLNCRNASTLLIHSYKRSFRGFSAYLTQQEANKLAGVEGVVSVFPSHSYSLRTTRSWDFIGLPMNVSRRASFESNLIIGVIDTGIWPESESFHDKGIIGPPPRQWKGTCQSSVHFKCNNKIIGARYYKGQQSSAERGKLSPRDLHGHGTHTAATAAGREVRGASMYGVAEGVARGGVPSARIAVYKACWDNLLFSCATEDVLAAFDDAIADGVDLIVAPIASDNHLEYFEDAVAIGSFHAMQRRILTSTPATDYSIYGSVANSAPWLLTLGASTIDRHFLDKIVLEDGRSYQALQLNSFASHNKLLPLIYGGDAPKAGLKFYQKLAMNCAYGSLDRELVAGKIVLCDNFRPIGAQGAVLGNAAGYVFSSPIEGSCQFDLPMQLPLPSICLGATQYAQLKNITRSTKGRILQSRTIRFPEGAPTVPQFSARGPNRMMMNILKPDVIAPGWNILSSWSPTAKLNMILPVDKRSSAYNIVFGTSVASAHAVGMAAYVKTHHPTWSPAAIRSALMTTALPTKGSSHEEGKELAYGAGIINGRSVLNPGLVYDAHQHDYVQLLCGQGYTTRRLRSVTGGKEACSHSRNGTAVWDLNYPSFALITINSNKPLSATFRRTVTNVGSARSTYHVVINNQSAEDLEIVVEPKVLSFEALLEKKSFVAHVRRLGNSIGNSSASIVWTDGIHHVRSPIFVASMNPFP